jgi:hypothetical protein
VGLTPRQPKNGPSFYSHHCRLIDNDNLRVLIDFLFAMRPPTIQPATQLELPDTTTLVGDTY